MINKQVLVLSILVSHGGYWGEAFRAKKINTHLFKLRVWFRKLGINHITKGTLSIVCNTNNTHISLYLDPFVLLRVATAWCIENCAINQRQDGDKYKYLLLIGSKWDKTCVFEPPAAVASGFDWGQTNWRVNDRLTEGICELKFGPPLPIVSLYVCFT